MPLFEPVKLTWKGIEYVIPANRVLRAVARVEEVITLQHLSGSEGNLPLAKVAMAYGSLLRFAGAMADDDDVYASLFTPGAAPDDSAPVKAVQTLLLIMLPKQLREKLEAQVAADQEAASTEGNASAATTPVAS